jgi:hypothetical protein
MTVGEQIAAFMPVAGSTTAAIVFLTTYRTGELRALLTDDDSTKGDFRREAIICTLLPLLTALLAVFAGGIAIDAVGELLGDDGFDAPEAGFVLFTVLLGFLFVYQFFLAVAAWEKYNLKE